MQRFLDDAAELGRVGQRLLGGQARSSALRNGILERRRRHDGPQHRLAAREPELLRHVVGVDPTLARQPSRQPIELWTEDFLRGLCVKPGACLLGLARLDVLDLDLSVPQEVDHLIDRRIGNLFLDLGTDASLRLPQLALRVRLGVAAAGLEEASATQRLLGQVLLGLVVLVLLHPADLGQILAADAQCRSRLVAQPGRPFARRPLDLDGLLAR